jgi:NAD(P)-dependent dehydrogenase (short-subunit alcohol dehydrogenase family)
VQSGIGLESSILFSQEGLDSFFGATSPDAHMVWSLGANVLLVDINLEAAEKGAALIAKRFPNVRALATKADVGKEDDIKGAVDLAVKTFGRLDVMVKRLTN